MPKRGPSEMTKQAKRVYHEAGKGDKGTPLTVSREEFSKRWEETFRKGKEGTNQSKQK